jgi:hypothetical protein
MKSFKQFLNESELTIAHDFKSFRKMVQEDCSEYLNNSQPTTPIFRGFSKDQGSFIYSRIRKDRKPLNTPQKAHEELDELFEKKFGFKYRSGSAFGSTFLRSASGYAGYDGLYAIFPENGYTLCGSNKIRDLWLKIEDTTNDYGLLFSNYGILTPKEQEKYQEISNYSLHEFEIPSEDDELRKEFNEKLFNNLSYFESKNPELYGQNEIMIKAKGFYGLQTNNDQTRSLSPEAEELI